MLFFNFKAGSCEPLETAKHRHQAKKKRKNHLEVSSLFPIFATINLNNNWTFQFRERADGVTAGGSAYPRSQPSTAAKEWSGASVQGQGMESMPY